MLFSLRRIAYARLHKQKMMLYSERAGFVIFKKAISANFIGKTRNFQEFKFTKPARSQYIYSGCSEKKRRTES